MNMNLYTMLGSGIGTTEATSLSTRLAAWHDAMVAHERRLRSERTSDACDDECPHMEARTQRPSIHLVRVPANWPSCAPVRWPKEGLAASLCQLELVPVEMGHPVPTIVGIQTTTLWRTRRDRDQGIEGSNHCGDTRVRQHFSRLDSGHHRRAVDGRREGVRSDAAVDGCRRRASGPVLQLEGQNAALHSGRA
jgi:hypothetical protein